MSHDSDNIFKKQIHGILFEEIRSLSETIPNINRKLLWSFRSKLENTINPDQLLQQKTRVEQYLNEHRNHLSVSSFINIFAWQEFFQFDFKIIDGCLCVFAQNPVGCFLYLPPLGQNVNPRVIEACFDIMEKTNRGSGVTRIENVGVNQLPLFPEDRFSSFNKSYEYCYYREDIAALRGKLYKSKRSAYNQFVRAYVSHHYAVYETGMLTECTALYRRWAQGRRKIYADDIYGHMLQENEKVQELVLRYHQPLGLIGRVVTVNGEIKAYSFGFAVHEDMFCILFEIADLSVKGLPVYMFRAFCDDPAVRRYKFINVMDDFGLENIRTTKMSFHPSVLLPSYVVTKR